MVVFGIDDSPVLEHAGKSFVVSIVFSEAFFDGFGGMADVVLMNIPESSGALLPSKNTIFVAPNASFRDVMVNKLTQEFNSNRIRHLLKGSGSFYGALARIPLRY
jgi:hypothetical protein